MEKCKCGNEVYPKGIKDLCRICYRQLPHIKTSEKKQYLKQKESNYFKQPEVVERKKLQQQTTKAKETAKRWKQKPEVKEKNRKLRNKRLQIRLQEDTNFRIKEHLRIYIRKAIKEKNGTKGFKLQELLGCSIPMFRKLMEIQMQPGMSWENHGKFTWHIGHNVPQSTFDLTKLEEQKRCWHWSNLTPEWAILNITKQDKY